MERTNSAFFVITAVQDDGVKLFMAIDLNSGGYEYWSRHITDAKIYNSESDADTAVRNRFSERLLHEASGANYARPVRHVEIRIEELVLRVVKSRQFIYSLNPA